MQSLLLKKTRAQPHELGAVLWAFVYFFALLAGYYVLRPLRDEMGMQIGAAKLQESFTGVFLTMLAVAPLFGWLNQRVARRTLLPWLYGFFIVNLLGFYTVLEARGEQGPLVARAFFVWVSVFNLFAISVFWSFMADLFTTEQAKRLYGFIAAGGTLGALTGPLITAGLVTLLGPKHLVLVSAGLLGVVILAIFRLRAWALRWSVQHHVVRDESKGKGETEVLRGSIWSGLIDVARSPYLRGICWFLLSYALLSTFLYFQSADLLPKHVSGSGERTRLLAQVDWLVNLIALLFQLLAFNRVIERLGIRFTLAAMPAVSLVGYALLAVHPVIPVLVGFGVLRRAGEYALSKPGRETLFNVLPPDQKYKAKNVIDTLVHRTGDTASAWVYSSLRALGLGSAQISWVAVPVAAAWLVVSLRLGRQAQALQGELKPNAP
ncbi:NTP/NDP exchange transporter [Aquabacterium sp.]|uniref:NTP/NDP exchange transporter n=1 Tax=Aquabacterium sp. TaxID=1872578 RepID=UPI0035B347BE